MQMHSQFYLLQLHVPRKWFIFRGNVRAGRKNSRNYSELKSSIEIWTPSGDGFELHREASRNCPLFYNFLYCNASVKGTGRKWEHHIWKMYPAGGCSRCMSKARRWYSRHDKRIPGIFIVPREPWSSRLKSGCYFRRVHLRALAAFNAKCILHWIIHRGWNSP